MIQDPDQVFIRRILDGDSQAYSELVDKHKRYAFGIALKILQNRAEAEEAAQDAFIKAYHNLDKFHGDAKFSTWLYRIVFNTAITYKRKHRQTFVDIHHTAIEQSQEAEGILEHSDKMKYLEKAMHLLNDADRTALTLFYLKEFSLEEIAVITGQQANTLKVRIHRARQRLAEELKMILNHEALSL
jgi:RNA polymerase sigma-70 factor (ECF subfamily)